MFQPRNTHRHRPSKGGLPIARVRLVLAKIPLDQRHARHGRFFEQLVDVQHEELVRIRQALSAFGRAEATKHAAVRGHNEPGRGDLGVSPCRPPQWLGAEGVGAQEDTTAPKRLHAPALVCRKQRKAVRRVGVLVAGEFLGELPVVVDLAVEDSAHVAIRREERLRREVAGHAQQVVQEGPSVQRGHASGVRPTPLVVRIGNVDLPLRVRGREVVVANDEAAAGRAANAEQPDCSEDKAR
eukprot:2795215-Prymnesium_polylepis.2